MANRGKKNTVEEVSEESDTPVKNTKQKNMKKTTKVKKTVSKTTKKTTKNQAGGKKTKTPKEEGKDRYFKLIDPKTGRSYGRYTGDTPKQAASKGYTKILQKLRSEGKTLPKHATTIYLRESTRGSARKVYGYEASRQKLPEPQKLEITDDQTGETKTIVYHFRNKIKKVAVPQQIGGTKTNPKKTTKKSSKKVTKTKTTEKKSSGKKAKKPAKKQNNAKATSSR